MKYFLDENFPKKAVQIIEARSEVVTDIRGSGKEGLKDNLIFELAQEEKALFCTTDRDFLTQVHFVKRPHCGILVIALSNPNARLILEKFNWFIDNFSEANISDKCFYITDNNCKIF